MPSARSHKFCHHASAPPLKQAMGCSECEIQLEGSGPWQLPDGGDDVSLIGTPGHTKGHVVLHYRPDKALLTGDHLMFRYTGQLGFSRA